MHNRVSTGVGGFDTVIDHLRYGDNVVWQVDSVSDYLLMASPYVKQAVTDGRKVVISALVSTKNCSATRTTSLFSGWTPQGVLRALPPKFIRSSVIRDIGLFMCLIA